MGSAVINGALEAISESPRKFSTDQLILRPFPQYETGERTLAELWEEYRQNMISLAGIAIFIYGNKLSEAGEVINAGGVRREFEIAFEKAAVPIPIGQTGYMSKEIADEVLADSGKYYPNRNWLSESVSRLNSAELSHAQVIDEIIKSVKKLQERD